MEVVREIKKLKSILSEFRKNGKKVGFVPTMGALHAGHISLIESSIKDNDYTIISIFVNPTQFNNSSDLEKYPRTLSKDLKLLESTQCDFVFNPGVNEIYSKDFVPSVVPLGELENLMEGTFRPGHFKGVVNVVERLFSIIEPHKAYFGRKDFQQVSIIRHMNSFLNLGIEIIECTTKREISGLAMSSRNRFLTEAERKNATFIYTSLTKAKNLSREKSPKEITSLIETDFKLSTLELEYFSIVDPISLKTLADEWVAGATACVVAHCGNVRLIDNLEIIEK
ncbi:MAG: pantoate--beta-alanine ligase [Psychromonas sp.]|jgi:pantoate--beta-alanine ligase